MAGYPRYCYGNVGLQNRLHAIGKRKPAITYHGSSVELFRSTKED